MSAQLGPYGQGQQYLPNPGSFVQNPAGTKQLTSFCFFRTVLFASGHKKNSFLVCGGVLGLCGLREILVRWQ